MSAAPVCPFRRFEQMFVSDRGREQFFPHRSHLSRSPPSSAAPISTNWFRDAATCSTSVCSSRSPFTSKLIASYSVSNSTAESPSLPACSAESSIYCQTSRHVIDTQVCYDSHGSTLVTFLCRSILFIPVRVYTASREPLPSRCFLDTI